MQKNRLSSAMAGFCAGAVTGLFGAGGGMVLVPLLRFLTDLDENEVFPASVSVILPVCLVSLGITAMAEPVPWLLALPYMAGSALGGIAAGFLGPRFPVKWLHRLLGLLIRWGGARDLCR